MESSVSPLSRHWSRRDINSSKRGYIFLSWPQCAYLVLPKSFYRSDPSLQLTQTKAKSSSYSEIICSNSKSQRSLWKAFNLILHRCPSPHLTACSSLTKLFFFWLLLYFVNTLSIIHCSFTDVSTGWHPPKLFAFSRCLWGRDPQTHHGCPKSVLYCPYTYLSA